MRAKLPQRETLYIVWLGGASCEGCTMAMLGASSPTIEELLLGQVPDIPDVLLVHPVLSLESGDSYLDLLQEAASGEHRLVVILEGSVLDEQLAGIGYFSRMGQDDETPLSTGAWVERFAPRADAVIAIGSCATWGGMPGAAGSYTGAMGLGSFLGADFRSRSGLPVINIPGCAPSGNAFVDALIYVCLHLQGLVPLELDDEQRPKWLYRELTSPAPPRTDYPLLLLDHEDLTVACSVPGQGWMRGIGGCASVGGVCIGCTDREFADRHLQRARVTCVADPAGR